MTRSKTPEEQSDKDLVEEKSSDSDENTDADQAEASDDSPEVWVEEEDSDSSNIEDAEFEDVTGQDESDVSPETEEEPAPETEAEVTEADAEADHVADPPTPAPVASPEPSSNGPGFFPLLLGGIVAAGLGYATAYFQPDTAPPATVDLSGVEADISAQASRVEALESALQSAGGEAFDSSEIEAAQSELGQALTGLNEGLAGLTELVGDLADRVSALENRPDVPLTPDGAQAMAEQLSAFQSELDAVTATARAEIEAVQTRASEIEQAAMAAEAAAQRRAAVAELNAALESGAPYAETLGDFENVPDGLSAAAESGVATLGELRESFPDAARSALAETQTLPEDGSMGDRVTAFLRRQTNARSLAPRDGDDPDAVLSRAEAALASGDLNATLSELEALPPEAMAQLEDWRASAAARQAALNGAATLTASAEEN